MNKVVLKFDLLLVVAILAISLISPGMAAAKISGCGSSARVSSPGAGSASSVKVAPLRSVTGPDLNLPTRSLGPCRSTRMPIGRPNSVSTARIAATRARISRPVGPIAKLHREWQSSDADSQQARLDEIRGIMQRYPMIPALKAVIARYGGDGSWATVRPPLVALTAEQRAALAAELGRAAFTMPGLGA